MWEQSTMAVFDDDVILFGPASRINGGWRMIQDVRLDRRSTFGKLIRVA